MTEQAAVLKNVESQAPKPRYPVVQLLLILVFMAIATFVTWLLHSGTNYQELYDFNLSHQAGGSLASLGSYDDPMPLYYWLIHSLSQHFTLGLTGLRILSLVAYILGFLIAFIVGYKATADKRIGMLAAALVGLSPFMLWYGGRGAVYAWLALIVLANMYFYVGLLHKQQGHWPGYIITALVGVASHYFFLAVIAGQLFFILMKRRQLPAITSYLAIAFSLVCAVGFTLWLRHSQTAGYWHYLPYTSKPSATNAFIIYVQYLFGFQSVVTTTLIIAFWPLLVALGLLAVQKYIRPPIAVQYFTFAAVAPVLAVFLLSWLWKPLFLSSYFIICLPPFMLALSWYLVAFELKALAWARYGLITVMIVMLLLEMINAPRAIGQDYLGYSRLEYTKVI